MRIPILKQKVLVALVLTSLMACSVASASNYQFRVAAKGLKTADTGPSSLPGPYNFTTCGATGPTGPASCTAAYAGTSLATGVTVSAGIQTWTVPETATYAITVAGASGGNPDAGGAGGAGAILTSSVALTKGSVLKILVGQPGGVTVSLPTYPGICTGGGGGTFVATSANSPIMVAGGGGGGEGYGAGTPHNGLDALLGQSGRSNGTDIGGSSGGGGSAGAGSGGGGAGFTGNGGDGGAQWGGVAYSFINGGVGGGGPTNGNGWTEGQGGFGGGGGAGGWPAGGGGGYSGGAGSYGAGGGGSYYTGTLTSSSVGNRGAGYVRIAKL